MPVSLRRFLSRGKPYPQKPQPVIYKEKGVALAHSLRGWEGWMNTLASGLLAS